MTNELRGRLNCLVASLVFGKQSPPEPIPDYCGDMAAAWGIVEYLDSIGRTDYFGMTQRPNSDDSGKEWLACFDNGNRHYGLAGTPALAICRAALKVCGVIPESDPDYEVLFFG